MVFGVGKGVVVDVVVVGGVGGVIVEVVELGGTAVVAVVEGAVEEVTVVFEVVPISELVSVDGKGTGVVPLLLYFANSAVEFDVGELILFAGCVMSESTMNPYIISFNR